MRPIEVLRSTSNRMIPKYDNCWTIGVIRSPVSSFLTEQSNVLVEWYRTKNTTQFLADPFPIKHLGKLYVFCEQFDRNASKGRIVCLQVDKDRGFVSDPIVAIDLHNTHLSYPFIFVNGEETYCVLQTIETKTISLYRAIVFPAQWEKVSTLVGNFSGVDATLFQHGSRWWLASSTGGRYFADELFMWYATNPLGPWQSHRANPVRKEADHCRPAGNPFTVDDRLYRPSQDCSETYGGRVTLRRVTNLTPDEYQEEFAANIGPNSEGPYPEGLHTVSHCDDLTFIDGKRHCFRNAFVDTLLNHTAHWKT